MSNLRTYSNGARAVTPEATARAIFDRSDRLRAEFGSLASFLAFVRESDSAMIAHDAEERRRAMRAALDVRVGEGAAPRGWALAGD